MDEYALRASPKGRRTGSPPLLQEPNKNSQPQQPQRNESQQQGDDDRSYRIYLERAVADPRFQTTLAKIFDEYAQKAPQDAQALNAMGRRRRPIQPRFSKSGKRLGRPPKPDDSCSSVVSSTKDVNDSGAYDGEKEVDGGSAVRDLGDNDFDPLWQELVDAAGLVKKTKSEKRARDDIGSLQSATNPGGAVKTHMDAGQKKDMLQKIQEQLVDRTVRRATMAREEDEEAEGRRRSGREKKQVNFGGKVSWERVSAERRARHKIKMHLRALSVQARGERKKKEKEEAEKAAEGKRETEELAAAAAADEAQY
ncbi:hypothetical protein NQ176_g709 [Zarea fungicola]|uniref:Uncharacterized protein n=1 Tax=Zarea fungicola TaxID=93591 RepID=A0ACC1NX19_9HYPO|nr:hypothetical protein NQ176_g709 [Lecanicillium fungicola]